MRSEREQVGNPTIAAAARLHHISSREHHEQFPDLCMDCREAIEGLAAGGFHVLSTEELRKAALCDRLAELLDAIDRDTSGPASPDAPYVGSPLEAQIRVALDTYRNRHGEPPSVAEQLIAADNLSLVVDRFARHCESRKITVPLWAGLLWDEVITSNEAYREKAKP